VPTFLRVTEVAVSTSWHLTAIFNYGIFLTTMIANAARAWKLSYWFFSVKTKKCWFLTLMVHARIKGQPGLGHCRTPMDVGQWH
jgi:hypothetical protein